MEFASDIENIDLESIISVLTGKFDNIESVYLFGSRRFESGSTRSDIDILITTNKRIKPYMLRDFSMKFCPALDIFILEDGKAVSVTNESFIGAESNESIIQMLNAVMLFDRDIGKSDFLKSMTALELDSRVDHKPTTLPNSSIDSNQIHALRKCFEMANRDGLPTKPFIGKDFEEARDFIVSILKDLVPAAQSVSGHGQARRGWTSNLNSEYDFQNLFWMTVKPWLPNLAREEVAIIYDGQEKHSDFSLFESQIIIEMKYIKNDGDKRGIVKTLEGLCSFYQQHPRVKALIFCIYVEKDVELDDRRWEVDYSYNEHSPSVNAVVVRNL
ncbi:MAG: hypothetical protein C0623_06910 [Desulfuromonas sp.]|nr:MAG: hypothetical protein C0623_06910 [Desulfuromonas sp.]